MRASRCRVSSTHENWREASARASEEKLHTLFDLLPVGISFLDPEGNRVELLIDTPWYVPQPHRLQVDLDQPDEQLWAGIEKHCRATPGFKPRSAWVTEIEQKIAAAAR